MLADVLNREVSREAAEAAYGVVLGADGHTVDHEATKSRREALRQTRAPIDWVFDRGDGRLTGDPPVSSPWPNGARCAVTTFDLDAESGWISRDPRVRERPGILSQGVGQPSRLRWLRELIRFVKRHDGVWLATCRQVAEPWLARAS